jgi:hypothetical protein
VYIAVTTEKQKKRFVLRESFKKGSTLAFRDLYDLGENPGHHIRYPGGNAFYFDEDLEESLSSTGAHFTDDDLEDLFWPWIRPDIRRAIETFRGRAGDISQKPGKPAQEKIALRIHPFDKRRVHYLKFAAMDQGPVENMPASLFYRLAGQCRDEIEQHFIRQEAALKPHELKSYVYTVFDIQSYFQGFMAKKMPHVLDQQKVDDCFIKALCRVNQHLFHQKGVLDDYLIRYAVMFFDYQYADTRLLDEMAKDFMFRHHFHKPMPEKSVPLRTACKVFKITKKEYKQMTGKQVTRLYRRLARKVHPDTGGSDEQFVQLNNAYKTLMEKMTENRA